MTVITIVIGSISYLYFCVLRTAYVKRKIVGKNHHNVNHADRSDASMDNTTNTNISMLNLNNIAVWIESFPFEYSNAY